MGCETLNILFRTWKLAAILGFIQLFFCSPLYRQNFLFNLSRQSNRNYMKCSTISKFLLTHRPNTAQRMKHKIRYTLLLLVTLSILTNKRIPASSPFAQMQYKKEERLNAKVIHVNSIHQDHRNNRRLQNYNKVQAEHEHEQKLNTQPTNNST